MRFSLIILAVAAMVSLGFSTQAKAGCIGAAVGEGCIGIPTPSERPYRYDDHERDRDHYWRHEHHHHHHDYDDED